MIFGPTLVGTFLFCLSTCLLLAQEPKIIRGATMENGSTSRLEGVRVENSRCGVFTKSNALGIFQIEALIGDTLVFTKDSELLKKAAVTTYTDMIVQLKVSIALREAVVNVQSNAGQRRTVLEEYSRRNAIYYEGKPPLWLLNPIGGRPLTFFRELLSKDAKRVRRMARSVREEERLLEINQLFSDELIKRAVAIEGQELKAFKESHTPDVQDLRKWTDYEKIDYIRKRYQAFQDAKATKK